MIIVDASIGLKLVNRQEKGSQRAQDLLLAHIKKDEEIMTPNYFYIEAANAIATKNLSNKEIEDGIKLLLDCKFSYYPVSENNLIEAALLAKKYHVSVYDMLYAVIAKENRANLITADEKFVKAVNLPYVKLLGSD